MRIKSTIFFSGLFLFSLSGFGQIRYSLSYKLQGYAISRILFFFPIRVFYESSLTVNLSAVTRPDGSMEFQYDGMGGTAYTLRTLGFSGREAVILYADDQAERGRTSAAAKVEEWKTVFSAYAKKVKRYHQYEYGVKPISSTPLVFQRSADGVIHGNGRFRLQLVPRFSFRHSIYFKVFPMLEVLLTFFDHSVMPPAGVAVSEPHWDSPIFDYSARINQAGAYMEKAVTELVDVKQQHPVRLRYQARSEADGILSYEGVLPEPVLLWKGFKLVGCTRLVRVQGKERTLLLDELTLDIRNEKGMGGYGKISLKIIE